MNTTILLAFFILGVLTGVMLTMTGTIYLGKRMLAKAKTKTKAPKSVPDAKPRNSVDERMKRIREITNEQLDLMQAQDHPQKNSLDGKYKNGLGSEIKDLEEEKTELLCSIIEDGHDPEVTTVNHEGVTSKMKLSQFIADSGITMPSKKSSDDKPKSKFTVHRGGKDDGGGTTH